MMQTKQENSIIVHRSCLQKRNVSFFYSDKFSVVYLLLAAAVGNWHATWNSIELYFCGRTDWTIAVVLVTNIPRLSC